LHPNGFPPDNRIIAQNRIAVKLPVCEGHTMIKPRAELEQIWVKILIFSVDKDEQ